MKIFDSNKDYTVDKIVSLLWLNNIKSPQAIFFHGKTNTACKESHVL